MESDNNSELTRDPEFCRLAWIASALDAARSHHAGKTEDELTAFGLTNPMPVQPAG